MSKPKISSNMIIAKDSQHVRFMYNFTGYLKNRKIAKNS